MRDWDKSLKKPEPKPAPSKEAISKGYAFPKCIQNINPCINLRKLVDLLESPISRGDVGRQFQVLNDFLDTSPYAFWLRDIPFVIRLFEAIVIKNKTALKFKEQLVSLFGLAAVPPMLVKQSEQLEYKRDFHHYFAVLGYLIVCIKDHEMKHLVVDAIDALLNRDKPVGYCCVSLDYCKRAATESDLPEIVGQLLEVVSEDLYEKLLEIAIILAETSKEACNRMVKEHAVEFVLERLAPDWNKREHETPPKLPLKEGDGVIMHCENSTRLLWLFLNNMEKDLKGFEPSLNALWSLHYAFRTSVLNVGQKVDRNNLAAIFLKLLLVYEAISIEESGIVDDVALLSVASEIDTKNTWACRFKFSNDDKDFIFKKILISSLPSLLQRGAILSLRKCSVAHGLVSILKKQRALSFNMDQHCELVVLVAEVLSILACALLEDDEVKRATRAILDILEVFTPKRLNSRIVLSGLRCLNKFLPVVSLSRGFDVVLSLTKCIVEKFGSNVSKTSERCLESCFYLLQQMYAKEFEKKTFSGVDLCLYLLKIIIDPNHFLLPTKVVVCGLHLLWDILESSSKNTRYFIEKGGLYSLLDVVCLSNERINLPALGVLVHACAKPICIPYLITWRKQGKRIMSLLMQLFRGSTEAVCTETNQIQFASEKINYLMNLCHKRNRNPPPVAEGPLIDLYRSKVYCILKVFNKYRENVELADESYKLFKEHLTFEDQITKMVAQNFLSLQLCEAWIDLDAAVKQDDISLVSEDREHLDDITCLAKKWRWHLKRLLEEQYDRYKYKDAENELIFYHKLNESTSAEAFDALRELKRIACCTERTFISTKHIRKTRDLDKTLLFALRAKGGMSADENYHKTEPISYPIAYVFDQVVEIESNKMRKETEVIDFESVSSDDDMPPGHDSDRDCLSINDALMCIDEMD